VNALGDVIDTDGSTLAGARTLEGDFLGTDAFLARGGGQGSPFDGVVAGTEGGSSGPKPGMNTTLVVVGTDLGLTRIELARLARLASGAFPRAISPVNTPYDGDVLFALSSGKPPAGITPSQLLSLGVQAREVSEEAIRRAVVEPSSEQVSEEQPSS
jgi:L-aminopeptidase/D-esterase-like protein